jgi:hypothetical protein
VPLAEDSEEYELEILDGPGGAVLRTETGITTTSFTYTSGRFRRRADRAELCRLPDQHTGWPRLRGRAHRGDPAVSNNLALAQVATAQNQKEVTINDQADQLDAGLTDKVDVAIIGTTSPSC